MTDDPLKPDDGEALKPGDRLGRYEIREKLGEGGMGSVYRARDTRAPLAGREVAIKVLLSGLFDSDSLQRFLGEAHALSRFEHPNIVRVIDCEADDHRPFIVMEYLKGEDLSKLLRHGTVDIDRGVDIILSVCAGVSACHSRGIIHRDLKPENVFLHRPEPDLEMVKLLDFGVSKSAVRPDVTNNGILLGTPRYMSPEQAKGHVADARSDQYAIALLLHVLLVRRKPFAEFDKPPLDVIARGLTKRTKSMRTAIPDELDDVIARALHVDPAQRFGTVHELGNRLLPFASDNGRFQWTRLFTSAPRVEMPNYFTAPNPVVPLHEPGASANPLTGSTIDENSISTARRTALTSPLRKSYAQLWFEKNPNSIDEDESGALIAVPTPSAPAITLDPETPRPRRRRVLFAATASLATLGAVGFLAFNSFRPARPQLPLDSPVVKAAHPAVGSPRVNGESASVIPTPTLPIQTSGPEQPLPPASLGLGRSAPDLRAAATKRKKPPRPAPKRSSGATPKSERPVGIEYTDDGSPILR